MNRRRLLEVAVASLLVVSGCATLRQTTELDSSINSLATALSSIPDDGNQVMLQSIARRIEIRARNLAAEHQEFVDSFDRLLSEYETTEAQLHQMIDKYAKRRKWLRDDLLYLQDELHASLEPEDWARVVQVLNQTGKAVGSYTLSGA
jgi:hypothetical protein